MCIGTCGDNDYLRNTWEQYFKLYNFFHLPWKYILLCRFPSSFPQSKKCCGQKQVTSNWRLNMACLSSKSSYSPTHLPVVDVDFLFPAVDRHDSVQEISGKWQRVGLAQQQWPYKTRPENLNVLLVRISVWTFPSHTVFSVISKVSDNLIFALFSNVHIYSRYFELLISLRYLSKQR